jgi:hypothetical protein
MAVVVSWMAWTACLERRSLPSLDCYKIGSSVCAVLSRLPEELLWVMCFSGFREGDLFDGTRLIPSTAYDSLLAEGVLTGNRTCLPLDRAYLA